MYKFRYTSGSKCMIFGPGCLKCLNFGPCKPLRLEIYTRICVCIYIYIYIRNYVYLQNFKKRGRFRKVIVGNIVLISKLINIERRVEWMD